MKGNEAEVVDDKTDVQMDGRKRDGWSKVDPPRCAEPRECGMDGMRSTKNRRNERGISFRVSHTNLLA